MRNHKKMPTDLVAGLEAIAELLFPLDGEMPYEMCQFDTAEEAMLFLDSKASVSGKELCTELKPSLALLYRGRNKESVVTIHLYEFLRLLRESEWKK